MGRPKLLARYEPGYGNSALSSSTAVVARVTSSPVTTSRPRIASDTSLGSAKRPHTAAT